MKTKKTSVQTFMIVMLVTSFLFLHCAGGRNGNNIETRDIEYEGVLMARPPGPSDTLAVMALRPPGPADTLAFMMSLPPGTADTLAVFALQSTGPCDTLAVLGYSPTGQVYSLGVLKLRPWFFVEEPYVTGLAEQRDYYYVTLPLPCGEEGQPPCITADTSYDFKGKLKTQQSKTNMRFIFDYNIPSETGKTMTRK
jgi:hypothetical protein